MLAHNIERFSARHAGELAGERHGGLELCTSHVGLLHRTGRQPVRPNESLPAGFLLSRLAVANARSGRLLLLGIDTRLQSFQKIDHLWCGSVLGGLNLLPGLLTLDQVFEGALVAVLELLRPK